MAQVTALSIHIGKIVDWVKRWIPWMGGVLLVSGLVIRYTGGQWTLVAALLAWLGSILAVAAVHALVYSRAKALSPADALARLDFVLGANNALSAAAAGCGYWPEPPEQAQRDDRLRISWRNITPPFLFSLVLAVTGALLPIPSNSLPGGEIPPPRSHVEIENALAQLEKAGTFEQKQIEELKKQLDSLRNQPAAEWYSHANIEAADHLQAGLLDQVRTLGANLNKAASGLEALKSPAAEQSSAEQQQAAANFKSALEKIKSSNPGLNQKLMESLSKIDPSALRSLSGKDLEDALNQMKQAAGACKNCAGNCPGGQSDAQSELERMLGGNPGDGQGMPRDGDGKGPPKDGDGPGKGGVARGPGVAPLPLSDSPSDLATSNPESLENPDLRRSGLGDALGSSDTEHKLDKTAAGIQDAGTAAGGAGGESVSHESLLPGEKALLKGVFR